MDLRLARLDGGEKFNAFAVAAVGPNDRHQCDDAQQEDGNGHAYGDLQSFFVEGCDPSSLNATVITAATREGASCSGALANECSDRGGEKQGVEK